MKKSGALFLFLIIGFFFQHCDTNVSPVPNRTAPVQWADLTLKTIQNSPPNSPTYTSRCLGYLGLTMYEAVVHGSLNQKTMAGQLNGLEELPLPETGAEYSWELSMNAAQAFMLKKLYSHVLGNGLNEIDELESAIYEDLAKDVSNDVAARSVLYGQSVAAAIYEWSKTDGGHNGYLNNFDPNYIYPEGAGYWIPPIAGQSSSPFPLHPHWGNNRTFVAANAALDVPAITPYSEEPSSEYYQFFDEVYLKSQNLSNEERRIAAWWADDPTQTASPPGHSYNLASIVVVTTQLDIFRAAEMYAKVGMAVADAFICCWKVKFTYHSERPTPYIKKYINTNYVPFWPEPPFPAFSSGHATQSAAAATVMVSIVGDDLTFVDDTYKNRNPDFANIQYRSRSFSSVMATADECAYSRFLGGIHTRQDNEVGNAQGKTIGANVGNLEWVN